MGCQAPERGRMNKQDITRIAQEFVQNSDYNYVTKENALTEELAGMTIFEEPTFAFGAADDEGFQLLKNPQAIGYHFLLPKEWMLRANTVISYFFPFTDEVIKSNMKFYKRKMDAPFFKEMIRSIKMYISEWS